MLKAQQPLLRAGVSAKLHIAIKEEPVVHTAADILQKDIKAVFGSQLAITRSNGKTEIVAGTIGINEEITRLDGAKLVDLTGIKGKWEAFVLKTIKENGKLKLVIAGSDSRGTAYGILELSRMIGISPWEWWADATPNKLTTFSFPDETIIQSPSVQYRGVFLNDEDWGLLPWSSNTFEPEGNIKPGIDTSTLNEKSVIGPKTYAKIFELLLRLRANTVWPAMHEVTVPFYFVEGTKEIADKYGIIVGTSHCEPLMRNSASEWDAAGKGRYNYVTNKDAVVDYWEERLKELKGAENFYTIGMRGKHDGKMEGVNSVQEYKDQLARIIPDQQNLLKKYIADDYTRIPQAFVPYKEVLEVYNSGLKVPDHVTLVWPDDNFGYIRHFPSEVERSRTGGNGVYYHLSYWGRPHDYLWLGTANPALEIQQMKLAYEKGARKIWIANVGDIKPVEYQTELFLDLAWNINEVKGVDSHLESFLFREFGESTAKELSAIMQEHYRLAHIRKPELLGNSRVYDEARAKVSDLPWTEAEIRTRLNEYDKISKKVETLSALIPLAKKDAFYQLVQYPVQAATQMNFKMLYGQLARHAKAEWALSTKAYDSIQVLTHRYNTLSNGKWNGMMDAQPRKLPVFEALIKDERLSSMTAPNKPARKWNALEGNSRVKLLATGLGYEGKAATIVKDETLTFEFKDLGTDSVLVEVRLLPTHAVSEGKLRFSVSLDGGEARIIDYTTKESSEEWKDNVLRNQAIKKLTFKCTRKSHRLTFMAVDEGVVLDQILLYKK